MSDSGLTAQSHSTSTESRPDSLGCTLRVNVCSAQPGPGPRLSCIEPGHRAPGRRRKTWLAPLSVYRGTISPTLNSPGNGPSRFWGSPCTSSPIQNDDVHRLAWQWDPDFFPAAGHRTRLPPRSTAYTHRTALVVGKPARRWNKTPGPPIRCSSPSLRWSNNVSAQLSRRRPWPLRVAFPACVLLAKFQHQAMCPPI